MTRRLLIFNLRTDADDHILGFTTNWINHLAQYYDAVDVLTTHKGRLSVAGNVQVYSVGRENGYSQPRRLLIFYVRLIHLLLTRRYTACFAHMQPLFAALAGPLLTLARVPLTTWYTHRSITRQLAWAVSMSRRVVSAVPESFPIPTPKLRAIGHGIDTEFFAPEAVETTMQPRIVYVARLTEIKRQDVLIRAVADLDCVVELVGDIPDGFGDRYKRDLLALVAELKLNERVILAGAQSTQGVRDAYHRAVLAVNLSPPGLFDKAALEAMACSLPTLVTNAAFDPLLGDYVSLLRFDEADDPAHLKKRLQQLLALSAEERTAIGAELRAGVVAQHSLDHLMRRLVAVLETGEVPD